MWGLKWCCPCRRDEATNSRPAGHRDVSDASLIESAIQECGITTSLSVSLRTRPSRRLEICSFRRRFETSPRCGSLPMSGTMLAALLSIPQVRSVALDLNEFDVDAASCAASALRANNGVTQLAFIGCQNPGDQVTAAFFQNLPRNLVWLEFNFILWHHISWSTQWDIFNGIRELAHLKSLVFRVSFLSDARREEFLKYLRTSTFLERVRLETDGDLSGVCAALKANASIEHVELSMRKEMNQETGHALGSFIRENRHMKFFGLVNFFRESTDEGTWEVARGLASSQNLGELKLDMMMLRRPSSGPLQTLLTQGVQMARGIKKLEVRVDQAADFTVLCTFLQTNTTLASLRLLHYFVEHDMCELLSSLVTNQTLEELDLPDTLRINTGTIIALRRLTSLRVLGVPSIKLESDREKEFEHTYDYEVMISSLELNLSLFEVRGNLTDISEQDQERLDRIFRRNRRLAGAEQGNRLPKRLWPLLFEWTLRNEEVGPSCVFGYLQMNVDLICE